MSGTRVLAVGVAILIGAGVMLTAQAPASIPTYAFEPNDPACQSRTLVSAGGQFPKNPHILSLRWTGYANYELVYNGQVILLDAYFDRGSGFAPLGFKAADVKKADAILIGHGHSDHMSDAASVGARTGAMVVGAPVTTQKLLTQSIDPKQVRTVTGRGGEVLEFRGLKIEPILGRHSENPVEVTNTLNKALRSVSISKPPTAEETAERRAIGQRGTADARVLTEGSITYLFTFDTGFRLLYKDTSGSVTDLERATMARVGRVDVAIVALAASLINTMTIPQALEHARTYKPRYYMPAHHDAPIDGVWRATEPIFQAIKDDNPNIITISKGYREPVCFNTEGSGR